MVTEKKRVWFEMVTESDARALVTWWNANTFAGITGKARYSYEKSKVNPRFFAVIRTDLTE